MSNIEEAQENSYMQEYRDVINEMSKVCHILSFNTKTENKDKKQRIE